MLVMKTEQMNQMKVNPVHAEWYEPEMRKLAMIDFYADGIHDGYYAANECDVCCDYTGWLEDISKNGIQKPIEIALDTDGKMYVVDGHHRWWAAYILNMKFVPVVVKGPEA